MNVSVSPVWPPAGVAIAALLFVMVLFRDLVRALKTAVDRDDQFIARAALLALGGFVFAGIFEYTYGHSLGLILLSFAVMSPLLRLQLKVTRV